MMAGSFYLPLGPLLVQPVFADTEKKVSLNDGYMSRKDVKYANQNPLFQGTEVLMLQLLVPRQVPLSNCS
jgi:hypothetical protein